MDASHIKEYDVLTQPEDLISIFAEHFNFSVGQHAHQQGFFSHVKRQAHYSGATVWNHLLRKDWHLIIPGLFLGMQPTATTGHPFIPKDDDQKLAMEKLGIKLDEQRSWNGYLALNVAVIENHALTGSFTGDYFGTITVEDYKKNRICHHWLNTPDESAQIPTELIVDTLKVMLECYRAGLPIYVHCKTGHGRSATILTAFLLLLLMMNDPTARDILLEYRNPKICEQSLKELIVLESTNYVQMIRLVADFLSTKRNTEVNEIREKKLLEIFTNRAPAIRHDNDLVVDRSLKYQFLQTLAQSYAFKKLSIFFSSSASRFSDQARYHHELVKKLIAFEPDWYQSLFKNYHGQDSEVQRFLRQVMALIIEERFASCDFLPKVNFFEIYSCWGQIDVRGLERNVSKDRVGRDLLLALGLTRSFRELSQYFLTTCEPSSDEAAIVRSLINSLVVGEKCWDSKMFGDHDVSDELTQLMVHFQQDMLTLVTQEPYSKSEMAQCVSTNVYSPRK